MRYVKWSFISTLFIVLTSFAGKDKTAGGLEVGDRVSNFSKALASSTKCENGLLDLKGKYVLLSFWASYDATSRLSNTTLFRAFHAINHENVEMVSVSFDEYESIFKETIRMDQIKASACFAETKGEKSELFKKYHLEDGFTNYLLNDRGVIVAKNIQASGLSSCLELLSPRN